MPFGIGIAFERFEAGLLQVAGLLGAGFCPLLVLRECDKRESISRLNKDDVQVANVVRLPTSGRQRGRDF